MSTPLAPPGPDEVHVWQVSLDVEGDELQALSAVLSADERTRAERFVRPCDASRSAAARGHLRHLLGRYLGCPAADVPLGSGPYGKPHIATSDAGWLRFNLSHSGDIALIAVANGREVGVDIERIQPELTDASPAKLSTPGEQRVLAGLAMGEYVRTYFWLWTRKEAVVKSLGVGLSVPLDRVDVLEDQIRLAPAVAQYLPSGSTAEWNVQSLNAGAEHASAVAVQGRAAVIITQYEPTSG